MYRKYASRTTTRNSVLDDAAKLAVMRAKAKVMVFGSHTSGDQKEIVSMLQRLKDGSHDTAHWLWIDLPWHEVSDLKCGLLA